MPNTIRFPSEALLAAKAPLQPVSGRADLIAHQALDVFDLWQSWEKESGAVEDVPYWATVWPAARLLAEFLLDQPALVDGKNVLDMGCGGGVAGLAALKAGAKRIVANDIDPVALSVAERNAAANGFRFKTDSADLLRQPPEPSHEIILVGDMFYDRTVSERMLAWLASARRQGSQVFIADGGRPFSPQKDVEVLREVKYPTNKDLEGRSERTVKLLAFMRSSMISLP